MTSQSTPKTTLKSRVLITALLAGVLGLTTANAWADHGGNGGGNGQGYTHDRGQGKHGGGRHGQGGRHGGRHGGFHGQQNVDLKLTADQVKILQEAHLIWHGKSTQKVGQITAGENNTFNVAILTAEGSLVETLTISAATGHRVNTTKP